jgi:catechol 2,3-dioxygenase-like lactoylglutathione lyase family enzyme
MTIPTLTNLDHVCITVPDLQQAVEFFVAVMGGEEVMVAGPYEDPESDWMAEHLRTHPRAKLNAGLVRMGPSLTLELYEIEAPGASKQAPGTDDVGYLHLSFRVGDLDRARAYLVEQGLVMHGEPTTEAAGSPLEGCRWQHFEAPWGLHLEIVQWPDSMPYEATTEARLTPAFPAWDNRA